MVVSGQPECLRRFELARSDSSAFGQEWSVGRGSTLAHNGHSRTSVRLCPEIGELLHPLNACSPPPLGKPSGDSVVVKKNETNGPILSHCNECGQETLHNLVSLIKRSRTYSDEYPVVGGTNWRLLQCCGCEEVALSRIDWCSEDDPTDPYTPVYFPPRVSRRKPEWLVRQEAPGYHGILEEIYAALHADSRRLAMMGARAVIDIAIAKKVGDQGGFSRGLNALEQANLLSKQERPLIEAAFDAGSAAMHRGHQPTIDDLNTVIDIVERVVHAEVLEEKVRALASATPKRAALPKKHDTDKN